MFCNECMTCYICINVLLLSLMTAELAVTEDLHHWCFILLSIVLIRFILFSVQAVIMSDSIVVMTDGKKLCHVMSTRKRASSTSYHNPLTLSNTDSGRKLEKLSVQDLKVYIQYMDLRMHINLIVVIHLLLVEVMGCCCFFFAYICTLLF